MRSMIKTVNGSVLVSSFLILVLANPSLADFVSDAKDSKASPTTRITSNATDPRLNNTEADKTVARQWRLTEAEWSKYKEIMQGRRGIWSPGLDPITALGVSAETSEERSRYASLWVELETERVRKELAFEVAREKAAREHNGSLLAVNNTSWIEEWRTEQNKITKLILYFVDSNCQEVCRDDFLEIYRSRAETARLDVFFPVGANAEEVGEWAAFMGIPPEIVRIRKVTLNIDRGEYERFNIDKSKLPEVRLIPNTSGRDKKG